MDNDAEGAGVHTAVVFLAKAIALALGIFSIVLHEVAHGFAAFRLGDPTAYYKGRLTLNPIAHLDLVGSVILPGVLLWRESDLIFGWARPVPVTPEKLRDPKRDHMRVSFAGPAANLFVTMIAVILLLIVLIDVRLLSPDARSLDLAMPSASVMNFNWSSQGTLRQRRIFSNGLSWSP